VPSRSITTPLSGAYWTNSPIEIPRDSNAYVQCRLVYCCVNRSNSEIRIWLSGFRMRQYVLRIELSSDRGTGPRGL